MNVKFTQINETYTLGTFLFLRHQTETATNAVLLSRPFLGLETKTEMYAWCLCPSTFVGLLPVKSQRDVAS